jgi:excisionase family DNA binding protein
MHTTDRFYSVEEAAAILAVCPRTIYDALRRGRIKGRKIGRLWRLKREWIDEFGCANASDTLIDRFRTSSGEET